MGAQFPDWVRRCVHENAPDHSTQTVEVGKLREAAKTIADLYDAGAAAFAALITIFECSDDDQSSRVAKEAADALEIALARARGEQ